MAKRRTLLRSGMLFGAAGLMLAAAGWLSLPRLAEHLATGWLSVRGHGPSALEVTRLGWSHSELREVRLDGGLLQAAGVELRYTPGGLLSGRLESMTLQGLRLSGRLGADGLILNGIDTPALDGGGDAGPPFGRLTLQQAMLALDTPAGRIDLRIDGTLDPGTTRGAPWQGRFDIVASGLLGGRMEARLDGSRVQTALNGIAFALPGLTAGGITGTVTVTDGVAAEGGLTAGTLAVAGTVFTDATLALDGSAETAGLRLRGTAEGAALDLALTVDEPFAASPAGRLQGTVSLGGGLPPLDIQASLDAWRRSGDGLAFGLGLAATAGSGHVAGFALDGGKLRLPLHAAWQGGQLRLTPAAPGEAELHGLRRDGGHRLEKPLRLTLPVTDRPLLAYAPESGDLTFAADAETAPLDLRTAGHRLASGAGRLSLAGRGHGAELQGALGWRLSSLRLPDLQVAAGETTATLDLATGRLVWSTKGVVSGEPAWLAPLTLGGELRPDGDRLAFSARAADATGRLALTVEGSHRPGSGDGRARLSLKPIVLAPDGLQPPALSPRLAGLTGASGRVGLSGTVAWGADDGGRADLALALHDLSLTAGGVRIERLNGVLGFDRLWPPVTKPGQALAAAVVDAGVPLTDLLADLSIDREGMLRLRLERLGLLGGQVRTRDLAWKPGDGAATAVFEVEGVDLGQALALAGLDGLAATGRLDGSIPIALRDGLVRVTGGRLDAAEPGVIRYRPATPPAALAGGGEQAALLLAALEDFRYGKLRLTLDRQGNGEMTVGLHLAGSNPALYGGYPIELNVNLSGALDRIVRDSLNGYRVPDRIRERLATFGEDG